MSNRTVLLFVLFILGMFTAMVLLSNGTPAYAKAVRVEARETVKADKVLTYVEPFKVRKGTPRRLYVEFRDGSAWVFTPCKQEDSRNCFWWAEGRGNGEGKSFVNLRGRTIYLGEQA